MAQQRVLALGIGVLTSAALAACGGGGSGSGASTPVTVAATAAPTTAATTAATAAPQVVTMSLPDVGAMGQENDPTFGLVGGYTQQTYSQVLGFAPGSQVMIMNGQPGIQHTFDVVSTTGFNGTATTAASGGSTLSSTFATGAVNPGQSVGPVTLTAGTYFIGCGFHFVSNKMRTVLVVAAAATPGPQATPVPGDTPPPSVNNGFGY
jgi:hypothetical protein